MIRAGKTKALTPKVTPSSTGEKKKSSRVKKRYQLPTSSSPSLLQTIAKTEESVDRKFDKEFESKQRSIVTRKELSKRVKVKKQIEEDNKSVEDRFKQFFSFFHIDSGTFFPAERWYQMDEETVTQKISSVNTAKSPGFDRTRKDISVLIVLATVDCHRKIILQHLDWETVNGWLLDKEMAFAFELRVDILRLIANLSVFTDSFSVLLSHKVIQTISALIFILKEDTESERKNQDLQLLHIARIFAHMTLNDGYSEKLNLLSLVIDTLEDTLNAHNLFSNNTANKPAKRLDKKSVALDLIIHLCQTLSNLSAHDAFHGLSNKQFTIFERLIMLQHEQNSPLLTFYISLVIGNICLKLKNLSVERITSSDNTVVIDFIQRAIECSIKLQNGEEVESNEESDQLYYTRFETPFESQSDTVDSTVLFTAEMSFRSTPQRTIVHVVRLGKMHKPVIYLYHDQESSSFTVELSYQGLLDSLYPKPDLSIGCKAVWNVTTGKEGTIIHKNRELQYLFWEGFLSQDGYSRLTSEFSDAHTVLVPRELLIEYLESTLEQQGLIDAEINDFMIYWLPVLNKFEATRIQFVGQQYEECAPLVTKPASTTTIRVFMLFRGEQQPVTELQFNGTVSTSILPPPQRTGTTLVEWGGMELIY